MRDDFCAFILTHGRPDRVHTYDTLMKAGYTGKVYIVIDDEDATESEYRQRFGDNVLQFSKEETSKTFDEGDNFDDRRAITYARNACWELARQVGCRYFIQFDDDYNSFSIRHNSQLDYCYAKIKSTMDNVLELLIEFYIVTPALSIAMSQAGDHIGGGGSIELGPGARNPKLRRKCMNSFICSIDRPFQFRGMVNEDVNTYTVLGRQGSLFFTVMQSQLVQLATQSNPGALSDRYQNDGTYIKSATTVCHSPSCVRVGYMGDHRSPHDRIHHKINWHNTAPKILRDEHRK